MKVIFDINRRKSILDDELGVARSLKLEIEEAVSNRALFGSASRFVFQAVSCILCGMPDKARLLTPKAKLWVGRAIETGEKTRNFEEWSSKFQRHLYAIIVWLVDGLHDQQSLTIYVEECLKWYQKFPDRLAAADLGLEAVTFIHAGAYQEYLSLAAPGGTDSIKCSGANEKQMALTLAVQVQATVRNFLDRHVGKWLNDGHAVRAAEWMKVIYWKPGVKGISPFDAVRKCLDHVES